ncbi:MAG: hypothetical protein CMN94_11685 [Synechococcus sp. EAC657]|mgnify:FL=1|nr:hypothetical protein [Synechococcus sp. EAC657]
MRIKAIAIASSLSAMSIAMPLKSHAATYDFWYAYLSGGLAAICDLHMNGVISSSMVREFNKNFLAGSGENYPAAASRDAVNVIREQEDFKDCPIRVY